MNKSLFAAANTPKGFINRFGDFIKAERLICLKGGSGVGKSTFIRAVAKRAESEGLDMIFVPCSSDAGSMDMLYIPAISLSVVDATAPHVTEPQAYGVNGEIFDLGRYIDKAKIEKKADIPEMVVKKSKLYSCLYSRLQQAYLSDKNISTFYSKVKADIGVFAEIAVSLLKKSAGVSAPFVSFGEYFTERGYRVNETLSDGKMVYRVKSENAEYAFAVIEAVSGYLTAKRVAHDKYLSAMRPDRLMGIGLEDAMLTMGDYACDRTLDIDSSIRDEDIREYMPYILSERNARECAIAKAGEYYYEARRIHAEIEKCYYPSMDFARLERDREELINEIFAKNKS